MGLRKLIFGKKCEASYKRLVRRAIAHSVSERKRVRSEDFLVYNFLSQVYENNRETIRKKYRAYQRLRDYELTR